MNYIGHPTRLLPGLALLFICTLFLPAGLILPPISLPAESAVEVLVALLGGGAIFVLLAFVLLFVGRLLEVAQIPLVNQVERWFKRFLLVPQRRYVGIGTDEERMQFEEAFEEIFDAGHSARFSDKLDRATEHLRDEGHSRVTLYTEFDYIRPALWVCCLSGAVLSFLTGYAQLAMAYRSLTPGSGLAGVVLAVALTLTLALYGTRKEDARLGRNRTTRTYATELSLLLAVLAILFWQYPALVRWYEPVVYVALWSNPAGVTLSFVLLCFFVEYVGAVYHNRRVRTVLTTLPAYAK